MFYRLFILFLLILSGYKVQANSLLEVANISFEDFGNRRFTGIPYAFYSTSTRFSYGGAIIARGYGQKDLAFVTSAYYSANDSYGLISGIYNYKLTNISDKLFMDLQTSTSNTENSLIYYNTPTGGTNNVRGLWNKRKHLAKFTYIYALKKEEKQKSKTKVGDLIKLDTYINAFETGAKKVSLEYFDQLMKVDSPDGGAYGRSKGLTLILDHDNRDDQSMPGDGSRLMVDLSYDPGSDDRSKYSKLEIDYSKYFLLKSPSFGDKFVLAGNLYYSRMLDVDENNLPAWFALSNLGGDERLRGYRESRFFGKEAIYAATEARLIPKTNIFDYIPLFKHFDIPWWQTSLFLEAGKVNDYDKSHSIFSNIKLSYGAGVSALVEGIVANCDLAIGEDTYYFRLYVNQSF